LQRQLGPHLQFAPHEQLGPHAQVFATGEGCWQPHLHSAPRQVVQLQTFVLFIM